MSESVPLPEPDAYFGGNVYYKGKLLSYAAAVSAAARDCRTCKWFHQPGDSPIAGCISHGRCHDADCYEPLPPVRLWRTT